MQVLILGGTTEASALARALAGDRRFAVTVSLAGRTASPAPLPATMRVGGFGGADGLAQYLADHRVDAMIDATHPFAAMMTRNAQVAARAAGVPVLVLGRPPWQPTAFDRWQSVADMPGAAAALGRVPRRVFLTVGRQDLAPFRAAPWNHYVVRSVDPPPADLFPPGAEIVTARGPFGEDDERRLLHERRIEILVTKNSGGTATYAKLAAARALGLPVVMVARPNPPDAESVPDVAQALSWLARVHDARRGV